MPKRLVLAQAARELLLLQSSDWQFLITTDAGRAYAIRRFSEHAERFDHLADVAGSGSAGRGCGAGVVAGGQRVSRTWIIAGSGHKDITVIEL